MWLRWVTSNISRQAARQKIAEATSNVFRAVTGAKKESSEPVGPTRIAFIFAMGIESGGLVDLLDHTVTTKCARYLEHAGLLSRRQVVIAESGVGQEAGFQVTQDVIDLHHPDLVIATGFGSSLSGEVHRGDVVMANEVTDKDGLRLRIGLNLSEEAIAGTPGLHAGPLVTVDEMLTKPKERHELAEETLAIVADLESLAVVRACQENKTSCMAIRLITEGVDDRLPAEIEAVNQQNSTAGRIGAVTGAMFQRLSSVKDMWKLKNEALKASDRLARFLAGVAEQVGEPQVDEKDEKQVKELDAPTDAPPTAEQANQEEDAE